MWTNSMFNILVKICFTLFKRNKCIEPHFSLGKNVNHHTFPKESIFFGLKFLSESANFTFLLEDNISSDSQYTA